MSDPSAAHHLFWSIWFISTAHAIVDGDFWLVAAVGPSSLYFWHSLFVKQLTSPWRYNLIHAEPETIVIDVFTIATIPFHYLNFSCTLIIYPAFLQDYTPESSGGRVPIIA